MHMADALISPVVGGTLWAVSAGVIGYSSKKIQTEPDDRRIPLMGVLGAFVFAAQMINFTIPATGASGHLGGGMILAILLGPHAAFLTMASVLMVQALFFADGGLLSLGCNIFNLGFFPCYIAYPLIYKNIAGLVPTRRRVMAASLIAAVVGLQIGSLGVVQQVFLSGVSELPMAAFLLVMQPIHLAIGIGEGVATAAVVVFVWRARPEILTSAAGSTPIGGVSIRKVLIGLLAAAIVAGGALSWFASTRPDGLEWSLFKVAGTQELKPPQENVYTRLAKIQEKTAILPDYAFKSETGEAPAGKPRAWALTDGGASVSGLLGGGLTLMTALLAGVALKRRKPSAARPAASRMPLLIDPHDR